MNELGVREGYVITGAGAASHLMLKVSPPQGSDTWADLFAGDESMTVREFATLDDVIGDISKIVTLLTAALHRIDDDRPPSPDHAPHVGFVAECEQRDKDRDPYTELMVTKSGIVLDLDGEQLVLYDKDPFEDDHGRTFFLSAISLLMCAIRDLSARESYGKSEDSE